MLGIGFFELLVIALVCFIAIGPKELPAVMRKLAGLYRQFVSLRDEFRFQLLSSDADATTIELDAPKKQATPSEETTVVARDKDHG